VIKVGRFGLAIVTALALGLEMGSSALAQDSASSDATAAPATTTGFSLNQDVTINLNAVIVATHTTPALPAVLPYNSAIPIVNVQPVVTSGQRPLIIGGAPCTITIYGVDAAGNLYDISNAAWMSAPQVVQWGPFTSGPPMPANLTPAQQIAFIQNDILDLGYSSVANASGKIVGMSFTEQAPARSPDAVSNIQVTSVVVMNNGTGGWSFNDLVSTVPAGTVINTPPTYDVLLEVPSDPPYTTKILNVPGASLTAAP
jgi:hypothetical protein